MFSLFGIPVRVHLTFPILLVFVLWSQLKQGLGMRAALHDVLLVLAVFACVVFHELAHALTARRFGIRTREITLYPVGGVASLERVPREPLRELAVAAAGPLASIMLAGAFYGAHRLTGGAQALPTLHQADASFMAQLVWINITLAAFNLLPAFPMDGGRMLRAILSLVLDRVRATHWAAALSEIFAVLMGAYGLIFNPMLAVLAVFLWLSAMQESAHVSNQQEA